MSPSDLLPPARAHLLKLANLLKITPPTGEQESDRWAGGGYFIFKSLTMRVPLGSEHLKRKKTSCHIQIDVFSSPGLNANTTGSFLCKEDEKTREESQNTFSSRENIRSEDKQVARYKGRRPHSFTTSRQSFQDSSLLSWTENFYLPSSSVLCFGLYLWCLEFF